MCELPGVEWLDYFDSFSFAEDGVLVTVAVIHGQSVDRPAARNLKAIDYDPGTNVLEIVAGGSMTGESTLRYFIAGPRRIAVAESDRTGVILVEDVGGIRTLIRVFNLPNAGSRDQSQAQVAQLASRNGNGERYV
jgi:hypothetical protein